MYNFIFKTLKKKRLANDEVRQCLKIEKNFLEIIIRNYETYLLA